MRPPGRDDRAGPSRAVAAAAAAEAPAAAKGGRSGCADAVAGGPWLWTWMKCSQPANRKVHRPYPLSVDPPGFDGGPRAPSVARARRGRECHKV